MTSVSSALTQTSKEFSQALAAQSSKGDNMDKEDFLLLLVTQFQYQDPLNPMEDQEFVAQMAQFSSLEQLMNLNSGMDSLTNATENQQMLNATSYIGKQVSISGNTIGKVTNADGTSTISTFRYAFGDAVKEGVLTVMDATGNTVYTEPLNGKAANTTFEFNWNGLNDKGVAAPDGTYRIGLSAYNSAGEAVLSDQVVDATVTSVVRNEDTVYIGLDGGQTMELANVRQVSTPKQIQVPEKSQTSTTGTETTKQS
ncbi:MAG: flagellar hook assembly protein FlgD [Desulfovibrio sp.]|nr:flagellar hook assembly protein FlgD [Desulfovibrio sp.]